MPLCQVGLHPILGGRNVCAQVIARGLLLLPQGFDAVLHRRGTHVDLVRFVFRLRDLFRRRTWWRRRHGGRGRLFRSRGRWISASHRQLLAVFPDHFHGTRLRVDVHAPLWAVDGYVSVPVDFYAAFVRLYVDDV